LSVPVRLVQHWQLTYPKVPEEIGELLAEQPLYLRRCFDEAIDEGFSDEYAHGRDA